jgi:transposase
MSAERWRKVTDGVKRLASTQSPQAGCIIGRSLNLSRRPAMNQLSTSSFPRTIGMDLGSRTTSICIVDPADERIDERVLKTIKDDMLKFFEAQPASRVVIEASGPSRWIAELAASHRHEVVVANPREFRLICESHRKTDRNDARILADFGQFRPQLLRPIKLRGVRCQIARSTLAARSHAVRQRTFIISFIRALNGF